MQLYTHIHTSISCSGPKVYYRLNGEEVNPTSHMHRKTNMLERAICERVSLTSKHACLNAYVRAMSYSPHLLVCEWVCNAPLFWWQYTRKRSRLAFFASYPSEKRPPVL